MKKRKQTMQASAAPVAVAKADGYVNFMNRLGLGAPNIQSATQYMPTQMITQQYQILTDMYCQSWIIGKIVGAIPEDMIRSGIALTGEADAKRIERVDGALSRLKIWTALQNALTWSRLFGGAGALILIEGQDTAEPLRLDRVTRGSFRGLITYDRWQVFPDWSETVQTIGPSYGLPKYWIIVDPNQYGMPSAGALRFNTRVHYTRFLRFKGIEAPHTRAVMEQAWGISVVERLLDRLVAFDTASAGAASLIDKAYLRTVQIKDLRQILGGPDAAISALVKNLEMIRLLQSSEGLTVLDSNDSFQSTAYTFTGLDQVLLSFGQQLSGAADIPLTRLFGQSPAGLNSTGDSDLKTYYDGILRRQESQLREPLTLLLDIVYRHLYGEPMPPEVSFSFVPLWQLTETDKAAIDATDSASVLNAFTAGLIDSPTALKELQLRGSKTGRWEAITDEVIADADDAPPSPSLIDQVMQHELPGSQSA